MQVYISINGWIKWDLEMDCVPGVGDRIVGDENGLVLRAIVIDRLWFLFEAEEQSIRLYCDFLPDESERSEIADYLTGDTLAEYNKNKT